MLLGNSSIISVGLRVRLINEFSGGAAAISANLKGMRNELRMYQNNLRAARSMYGGLALAGGLGMRAIYGWVREGAKFDYTMQSVKAVTSATTDEFQALRALSNKIGKETMFMPEDIASGARFMGMAGMSAKEILGNLGAAANLAGSTFTQLGGKGGTADVMTNIMKGFKLGTEQSVWVSDVLTKATTRSNTSLFDLGDAIKYAAATATDLKQSLPTVTAMAMTLGSAGIQGSMAGTAIENMFRYLAKGLGQFRTKRQTTAWQALGLAPKDVMTASGDLKNMADIIEQMGKNLTGMGAINRQGILQEIFGVRGKRSGSKLISDFAKFKSYIDLLSGDNVKGESARIMGDVMNTLEGSFLRLTSAFKAFKNALSKNLEKPLRILLDYGLKPVIGAIEWFLNTDMGKWVAPGLVGLLAFKTAAWTLKFIIGSIGLATSQMGVNFKSARMSVVSSWRAMTASANQYRTAATMAGMTGAGVATKTSGTRVWMGAGGRYFGKTKQGGTRRISEKLYNRYASRVVSGGGKIVSRGGGLLAGSALLRGIGGIFGRLIGVLTGPLGMVLMLTLPTLIGGLTSMFKKHKASVDKNTKAINQKYNSDAKAMVKSDYFAPKEIYKKIKGKTMENLYEDLVNIRKDFSEKFSPERWAEFVKEKTVIQIIIDGREAIKEEMSKLERRDNALILHL